MTRKAILVPWKAWEAVSIFAASWIGVPAIVLILVALIIGPVSQNNLALNFGLVMAEVLVGFGLIWMTLRRYQAKWADVGLRKANWGKAAVYVLIFLVGFLLLVTLIFAIVSALVPSFNADQAQVNEFTQPTTTSAMRISFLALVILPPFFEEVIFRGFIFPAFTRRLGIIGGALMTSLLFAVAHWQLNVSLYTLILSLLLCFMYYKLRSIWPGIVLHMINNFIAFSAIVNK